MIFQIGGRRYAFDFSTSVTEINPAHASVVSINRANKELDRVRGNGRRPPVKIGMEENQ